MKYTIIGFLLFLFLQTSSAQNWYSPIECLQGIYGSAQIIEDDNQIHVLINHFPKIVIASFDEDGNLQDIKAKVMNQNTSPFVSGKEIYILTSEREYENSFITIKKYNLDLEELSTMNFSGNGRMSQFDVYGNHIFISRYDSEISRALVEKFSFDGTLQDSVVTSNSGSGFDDVSIFSDGSLFLKGGGSGKDFWYLNPDMTVKFITNVENGRIGKAIQHDDNLIVLGNLTDIEKGFLSIFNSQGIEIRRDTLSFDHDRYSDIIIKQNDLYLLASSHNGLESYNNSAIYKFENLDIESYCIQLIHDFDSEFIDLLFPTNIIYASNGLYYAAAISINGGILPSLFKLDSACNAENEISNSCESVDEDNDGFNSFIDCDDTNSMAYPGQEEIHYNGIDDDCNPYTPDDDLDYDGFILEDDCNDANPNINPDAEDIPNNGIDEDCNGEDLTSIHELANTTIKIYPNPATTNINIETEGSLTYRATLYDLNGKQIVELVNPSEIDVEKFIAGTYLLEIKDLRTGEAIIERIMVEE